MKNWFAVEVRGISISFVEFLELTGFDWGRLFQCKSEECWMILKDGL
jgi:hypothetical protein